jgi:hypothetical protein
MPNDGSLWVGRNMGTFYFGPSAWGFSANRALDEKLERLMREKTKLAAALRSPEQEDFVEASIRQFCATANARLHACSDFDDKRQFLMGYVERVVYNRYDVTIVGAVPIQSASGETKRQFRIEGKIDIRQYAPNRLEKLHCSNCELKR